MYSVNFPCTVLHIGLPEGFDLKDYKPPVEVPCLIKHLCQEHDGVLIEAKGIKEHWWKPHIKKQFERKVGISECSYVPSFQVIYHDMSV
jgi:hypothetical protein